MVYIKKLEVKGFKSFGNRNVAIQLDRGLIGVTGPNGSGKSNIIDSIIFGLGQNSPRALRVNRLPSLIYDGGETKADLVRVTITLDNSDRLIAIDNDSVVITRELRSTGESAYYLNGKRVQKGTLAETLDLAMINPDGINFVPQGLVTRLSELTPEEKRGLIEEIVGVSQFDDKKAQAIKQLDIADVNLKIALARLGEIKSRVDSLEGERNDELRLRFLEDEINWVKAVLASKRLAEAIAKSKAKQNDVKDLKQRQVELEEKLEQTGEEVAKAEDEKNEFFATYVEGKGGKPVEVQIAVARATNELERTKQGLEESSRTIVRIEESLPYLNQMRTERTAEIETARRRVAELSEEIAELDTVKTAQQSENLSLEEERGDLLADLQGETEKLAKLEEKNRRYNEALAKVSLRIADFETKQIGLKEKLSSLETKSKFLNDTLTSFQNTLQELERVKEVQVRELESLEGTNNSAQQRKESLERETEKAIEILQRASETLVKYESQRLVADKIVGEEITLAKLQELANSGALSGYLGRVSELLKWEKTWEKAVRAAGRSWFNSAVVEDLPSLVRTVEAIKRLKLGRITIIPLSEVVDAEKASPPKEGEVMGSVTEFVRGSGIPRGLVNFIFGDAILVKNTKSAYALAKQGYRTVTPNGDLFETGGSAFDTGRISEVSSIAEFVVDDESQNAMKEALASLQSSISKRKQNLESLKKQTKELDIERIKKAESLGNLAANLTNIKGFLSRYQKLASSQHKQIERAQKSFNAVSQKLQSHLNSKNVIETKIAEVRSVIDDNSIQSLKDKIQDIDDSRVRLNQSIDGLRVRALDLQNQLARANGNLEANLEPTLRRLEEEIRQQQEELERRKNLIESLNKAKEALEAELAHLKGQESEAIEASRRLGPILDSFEERLRELRRKREAVVRSIANAEKDILAAYKELERLTEGESACRGELSLYGFSEPLEYFESSQILLPSLTNEYESLRNSVNLKADTDYRQIYVGYRDVSKRRNQLENERNAIVKFIQDVDTEKKQVFMEAFTKIDRELRGIFSRITAGSAWLELETPDDVFNTGVYLMTQFPGKIPRESGLVSGGEKTVSALSLILAIQAVNPAPFYIFDEIDAHLDAVNSDKLAELLKERAANSQIVIVSLKDSLLSRADLMFGVYMQSGVSQMVRYQQKIEVAQRTGRAES
ncbi:MAG: chromosome segregation protein SMC [Thaumarchaeota archaeon]|nr:chromosome segregation protein SMC [Nitrososphaerota archaeon]